MSFFAGTPVIRSRQNDGVKALRAAFANNGRIEDRRVVAIEGEHLVAEASRSGLTIEEIFVSEEALARFEPLLQSIAAAVPTIHILAADVFESVVATEAPQGIAAFVQTPTHSLAEVWSRPSPLLLVLDGIQDPGNLGTILRTAEAFGAQAIIGLPGTASPWNLKAVRASAGSVFRLPLFAMPMGAALEEFRARNVRICAGVARDGIMPEQVPWSSTVALCIGNEGRGLSAELLAQADELVTIPAGSSVESLNAAVAASILLYEAARHRTSPRQL
jgi:TrmH family RNA methyltransferase